MVKLTVQIPNAVEASLRRQAEAAGKPIEQLVTELLQAQLTSTTLADISAPVQKRFLASGMSEEELAEALEREDHGARGVPYNE
jgi:hypothetical protein